MFAALSCLGIDEQPATEVHLRFPCVRLTKFRLFSCQWTHMHHIIFTSMALHSILSAQIAFFQLQHLLLILL